MPVSKQRQALYPGGSLKSPAWLFLRNATLARARFCCEFCHAPDRIGKVVLTTAHLDHDPKNSNPHNLRALCQRCHNRYDAQHRSGNRQRTRALKQAEMP